MVRNKLFAAILSAAVLFVLCSVVSFASTEYQNPDTGYTVVMRDDAGLLSESEREALASEMAAITEYGHAAFHTVTSHSYPSTESYASAFRSSQFGIESSTVFLIDMQYRKIYIWSYGTIYEAVTDSKADSITDNVYRYASDEDYYGCASEAFSEMKTILSGGRIAEPMKLVSNLLIALAVSFLVMYLIVHSVASMKAPSRREILASSVVSFDGGDPTVVHTGTTRRYSPVQKSSGSSGGGGGGGFSGGGGGGGGGHSF